MTKDTLVGLGVALAAAIVFVSGAAAGASRARPDLAHFESRSVEIGKLSLSTTTNVLPPPEARVASDVLARIGFILTNKTDRDIWLVVRLTPPLPSPPCPKGHAHLEPKQSVEFRCTQEDLVAGEDYPIDVVVCADSALADTVEQCKTRLRFDGRTVGWLQERLAFRRAEIEADKLPKPDESIALREPWRFDVVLGISGGVVVPTGDLSDGFGRGGMGTTFFGLTGRRLGARLAIGSSEPGTRGRTNDAYSLRLGRRVQVMRAIVPCELQGTAAFPTQSSRLAVALEAGGGLHFVTVRLKNTDDRLDEERHFGFSAGAGVRCGITPPDRTRTVSAGLNGVFHGTGASRYVTVELELVLLW